MVRQGAITEGQSYVLPRVSAHIDVPVNGEGLILRVESIKLHSHGVHKSVQL